MAPNSSDLSGDLENLKADLSKVKEDLSTIANHLVATGKESARELKQNVESNVRSGVDSLQSQIEAKPVTSALVAMGVGFILGCLLSRR